MKEIWSKIIEFNNKYFPGWRESREPIFFSNALAGEVGEICNAVKHLYGGGTNRKEVNEELVALESVDALIYLVLLLDSLGFDYERFSRIFDFKMCVLRRRMERAPITFRDTPRGTARRIPIQFSKEEVREEE